MAKNDRKQHTFNQAIIEELANQHGTGNISYFTIVRKRLDSLIADNKRILVKTKDTQYPQNCSVVTLEKTYDRFAKGYVENRVSHVKIPYTLNYSLFADRKARVLIIEE